MNILKTYKIDVYGGLMNPGEIWDTSSSGSKSAVSKQLPLDCHQILGWDGSNSTFSFAPYDAINQRPSNPGLHLDTWISLQGKPSSKEGTQIIGYLSSGDAGHAEKVCMFPAGTWMLPPLNRTIYIGYWAHNMRPPPPSDWHTGYTIYYI